MERIHIFNKEHDSEKIAMDIVAFLRKWGMWKDVQIFTGGKCYSDGGKGELLIRDEEYPEQYTGAYFGMNDCTGKEIYKDYSNSERMLDMTMEGSLSLLLRHHEYEVSVGDLSEEAKHIIIPAIHEAEDEVEILVEEYFEGRAGWDPAEYDSYEEWLELNQHCGMGECNDESGSSVYKTQEFSSREEYEDYLSRTASEREEGIRRYFEDEICAGTEYNKKIFFDDGRIAERIISEFDGLLEKYGLWYEMGFDWSLTTYRI